MLRWDHEKGYATEILFMAKYKSLQIEERVSQSVSHKISAGKDHWKSSMDLGLPPSPTPPIQSQAQLSLSLVQLFL